MEHPLINFQQAKFQVSAPSLKLCPMDKGAEVAFAGRSNAGKSSALNTLTNQNKLARTSKTPGRTQLINFFSLTDSTRLVDLPGYGFAKVPDRMKREWQKNMSEYLEQRKSLKGVVLVMDIRHPLTEFDLMMCEWADAAKMPIHILLTKSDKLKRGPAQNTKLSVQKQLSTLESPVTVQTFSALKKQGTDTLQHRLSQWLATEPEGSED